MWILGPALQWSVGEWLSPLLDAEYHDAYEKELTPMYKKEFEFELNLPVVPALANTSLIAKKNDSFMKNEKRKSIFHLERWNGTHEHWTATRVQILPR
jgi:hypothetical protein